VFRDLMFRSIVFATDLSDGSRMASRYAAVFARHYEADLIVAHAFLLSQPAAEVEILEHICSQQRRELEQRLLEIVESLGPPAGSARSVLRNGTPLNVVQDIANEYGPSLVVLGTHGAGALEHHIIGSVAEDILRTVRDPVLTVGPHVEPPTSRELRLRRILLRHRFLTGVRRGGSVRYRVGAELRQRD
jgi:nucleotide-binding universal stress UspA family protein